MRIQRQSIGQTANILSENFRFSNRAVFANGESKDPIGVTFDHVKRALVCRERQTIRISKGPADDFGMAGGIDANEESIPLFPLPGVGDVKISRAIEEGEIRAEDFLIRNVGSEYARRAIRLHADDALRRIADEQFIRRREGHSAVEGAQRADRLHIAARVDSIDLPGLSAGPEKTLRIKRAAFGMIEPAGEDRELFDGDQRIHARRPSYRF